MKNNTMKKNKEKKEGKMSGGKGSLWFYVIILVIGALIGSVIGEIIGEFSKEGLVHDVFVKGIQVGLNPPPTLDLKVFSLTIGFAIKLNLASVIGILLGAFLIKKIA